MRFHRIRPVLPTVVACCLAALATRELAPAARADATPDSGWFQKAKFGLFIHWGLYSAAGNQWDGKTYHGSAEWLMHRAKIPAAEYAQLAAQFDPEGFDGAAWARFAREAGARYVVITAKHHEGFAMFGSKVSSFNIVDATPYRRDPMTALSDACRREGLKFGFYYSQFLDWHEPDGGGNSWDFPGPKQFRRYYAAKSVPQIHELLSNYGPLGLVWFDMPGGLSADETRAFVASLRQVQPACLISSRVGHHLGDFRDFGDSELPPAPIAGPWEALFTHNDSWGYDRGDLNFKTPGEVLRLLAGAAARGGNLLLNVGPDGNGRIPEPSLRYLRAVGAWLARNGESIYGTAASPVPDQPWGVATLKPGRLYLHVFERPRDGVILVPDFAPAVSAVRFLTGGDNLRWSRRGNDLRIPLPASREATLDQVITVTFAGEAADNWGRSPAVLSRQYARFPLEASAARLQGAARVESLTSSEYFGNWKHSPCIVGLATPADRASFAVRFLEPGDYRVALDYSCSGTAEGREGVLEMGAQRLTFSSLYTGEHDEHRPLLFFHHAIGILQVTTPGPVSLVVRPQTAGREMFALRRISVEPVSGER